MSAQHWALKYIGQSYIDVGMCWGLVQLCCRERFGAELPPYMCDEHGIRRFVTREGWRKVDGLLPREDDIVVMMGPDGRHVGFAVNDGATMQVMHANGTPLRGGMVELNTLDELRAMGHAQFEFWRQV